MKGLFIRKTLTIVINGNLVGSNYKVLNTKIASQSGALQYLATNCMRMDDLHICEFFSVWLIRPVYSKSAAQITSPNFSFKRFYKAKNSYKFCCLSVLNFALKFESKFLHI